MILPYLLGLLGLRTRAEAAGNEAGDGESRGPGPGSTLLLPAGIGRSPKLPGDYAGRSYSECSVCIGGSASIEAVNMQMENIWEISGKYLENNMSYTVR